MASVLSNSFGYKILHTYINQQPVWLALHTDDPTATGDISTEVASGGYARQRLYTTAPSSKTISNSAKLVFSAMPAAIVKYFAVWDAFVAGNMLLTIQLTPQITVPSSGQLFIAVGDIAISL